MLRFVREGRNYCAFIDDLNDLCNLYGRLALRAVILIGNCGGDPRFVGTYKRE